MKKIGILCAGDTELEPFFSYLKDFEIKETAMLKFYISQFRDVQIIAAYSGVCKVNAAIAAQVLIDTFHVDALINGGTAGGMDKNVQLLDTVISQRMIYHDMTEDILTDFHPWLKNNHFHALIDFGVMAVGDPACDYAMAWTYFDKKARKIFLDELKEDMVDRARGWALWKALITYNDENPIPRENAHFTIREILLEETA